MPFFRHSGFASCFSKALREVFFFYKVQIITPEVEPDYYLVVPFLDFSALLFWE